MNLRADIRLRRGVQDRKILTEKKFKTPKFE